MDAVLYILRLVWTPCTIHRMVWIMLERGLDEPTLDGKGGNIQRARINRGVLWSEKWRRWSVTILRLTPGTHYFLRAPRSCCHIYIRIMPICPNRFCFRSMGPRPRVCSSLGPPWDHAYTPRCDRTAGIRHTTNKYPSKCTRRCIPPNRLGFFFPRSRSSIWGTASSPLYPRSTDPSL